MKALIATVILLLVTAPFASAQNTAEPSTGHLPPGLGYVFVGDATHGMGLAGGFGGEFSSSYGLGVGLEVGAVGLTRKGDQYYNSYTTGLGSADVLYHYFPKKLRAYKVSPFAAGGYTILFGHTAERLDTAEFAHNVGPLYADPTSDKRTNGFNIGGGVDLFARKHAGVRFDVRYYGHGGRILKNAYPDLAEFSFVAFRVGLTLR
jgi:hypothetical protein